MGPPREDRRFAAVGADLPVGTLARLWGRSRWGEEMRVEESAALHAEPVRDVRERVDDLYRRESRRVLATLIRLLGDFDLRRGGAARGVSRRAGAVAARRRAGESARLAGVGRPLQGHRRHPPASRASPARRRGPGRTSRPSRTEPLASRRRRGRPAAADLHLLPPGAVARRAGGAHPARGVRPDHRGDRRRVPGAGADPGPAHRARQGEDPRRRHPLPGARRRPSCPSASTPCCGSSTWCSTRATRRARGRRR